MGLSFFATMLTLASVPANLIALTWDPTVNERERPSLLLDVALSKATKALQGSAKDFVCTEAESRNRKSGGGWAFFFRSRTLETRSVKINEKEEVVANNDAAPKGTQFKTPPILSIDKAIEIAVGTRERPKQWFSIGSWWNEKDDEWGVSLLNATHRERIYVFVDSKGKVREQKGAW